MTAAPASPYRPGRPEGAATRIAQGLPGKVTDPEVIRKIAKAIVDSERRKALRGGA